MKSESSIIDDCCCRTSNKNVLVVNVFREMMQLKTRLSEIKQNPVMKEFLEDPDNQTTFYKAIEQPTEKNLDALDEKFKTFYRINRIIRYLSGFIR
ncbi:hypothetical protein GWP49_30515, partial [Klebsiella pneumoniae]|nr:hypothetical protein [Klebsiella pneumoniae]